MKDIDKLKQFILEKAKLCIHNPHGQLKFAFVTPSFSVIPGNDDYSVVSQRSLTGHYLQMYDWDACFFSQAAKQIGVPELAKNIVDNFLSLQRNDGYIPRTISPYTIWDDGDLCKPFLAQTLLFALENGELNSEHLEAKCIDQLDKYLQYYVYRRRHKLGLYHWRNALESGVDNNLALIAPREAQISEDESVFDIYDGRLLACDLNAYLVQEFSAFAKLADHLAINVIAEKKKFQDLSIKYDSLANGLQQAIEEILWNNKVSLYCNFDPNNNEYIPVRSWTGFAPVFFGIASQERTEEVIRKYILSENRFFRPAGLSTEDVSGLFYNQAKRGLYERAIVSNWQGPMWVLPNVLAVRCLLKYDFKQEARELASRVVKTLSMTLKNTGTLFENYNAETGSPLWAPDFISWNILALELIDFIL